MASLNDIERKQREIRPLIVQLSHETDAARIQELAKRITEMTEELGRMARGLEKEFAVARGSGQARVVLTKAQKERIAEAAGSAPEMLVLDDAAAWDAKMPSMSPAAIEQMALASIAAGKMKAEKRKAARKILEQMEAAVGDDPAPEAKAAIEAFKKENLGE
jgi:hypothetical protein